MKINKSLDIDLNIISPQKHIRIHEGDVDSVDILIGVTVDDESVDLDGVTIKYDATINNYLAEQDADGSVVENKISIPVTQNMTAMSGLLLIDVRMIQNDQILFTQTICATVENAVVNGSTYIDFDKITIIQRMNALEEKMDYIEELVENFDTSKLIVSVNRPPEGAPAEVDVDLLRVGDTWILSGYNIVYKLVKAQYNYSPAPGVEPRHYFTWQSLNERYGVDNTEPPTSVTYQEVVYSVNEVQWSWLPVPEYFKGDHYQMLIGLDDPTYYICNSGNMASTGVCTYTWREEGGSVDAYTKAETNALLADKMDLAPLNPTAEQIAALRQGQVFATNDTVGVKTAAAGTAGDLQAYKKEYIDSNFRRTIISNYSPPEYVIGDIPYVYEVGTVWVESGSRSYILTAVDTTQKGEIHVSYTWRPQFPIVISDHPPNSSYTVNRVPSNYGDYRAYAINSDQLGDVWLYINGNNVLKGVYLCYYSVSTGAAGRMKWQEISKTSTTLAGYGIVNAYTKTEIDTMIGDIETALSEV